MKEDINHLNSRGEKHRTLTPTEKKFIKNIDLNNSQKRIIEDYWSKQKKPVLKKVNRQKNLLTKFLSHLIFLFSIGTFSLSIPYIKNNSFKNFLEKIDFEMSIIDNLELIFVGFYFIFSLIIMVVIIILYFYTKYFKIEKAEVFHPSVGLLPFKRTKLIFQIYDFLISVFLIIFLIMSGHILTGALITILIISYGLLKDKVKVMALNLLNNKKQNTN